MVTEGSSDASPPRAGPVLTALILVAADPAHCVRGQHDGYRAIAGLAADSQTETDAALRLEIDNWPSTGIRLLVEAQRGAAVGAEQISLDTEFAAEGGEGPTPYEVLLQAAMEGGSARFTRQDSVEEAWRLLLPLLHAPPPVQPYAKGSWGPPGADALLSGNGRRHEPWVRS